MRVRGNLADLPDTNLAAQAVSNPLPAAIGAYFYISTFAGLLLIFAAIMKQQSPIEAATFGGMVLTARWVRLGVVFLEAAFALWLLSGAFARIARITATICFGIFLCITLYETYAGAQSCSCFGNLHIHPIYTAALDTIILVAFAISHPQARHGIQWQWPTLLVPILLLTISVSAAAMVLAHHEITMPEKSGDTSNGLIVMDPETWIGKPLPILKYIDRQSELAHGKWIVILYRHDCPVCRKEVPRYVRMAEKTAADPTAPRITFVEIPPYGNLGGLIPPDVSCLRGQLSQSHQWFVETPVVMKMNNGVVTSANQGAE